MPVGAGVVGGTFTNGGPVFQVQASNGMTLSNSNPSCFINLNNGWGASATYSWQIVSQSPTGTSLSANGSSATITCSAGRFLNAVCTVSTPCGSSQVSFNCFNASGGSFRLAIYPNPADKELTVATVRSDNPDDEGTPVDQPVREQDLIDIGASVRLLNQNGNVVGEGRLSKGRLTLSVGQLPNDTYFLHLLYGEKQLRRQVVVRR